MIETISDQDDEMDVLQKFRFDLNTLVTALQSEKEMQGHDIRNFAEIDLERYQKELDRLDEVFEDHKTGLDDDALTRANDLLNEAENLLNALLENK